MPQDRLQIDRKKERKLTTSHYAGGHWYHPFSSDDEQAPSVSFIESVLSASVDSLAYLPIARTLFCALIGCNNLIFEYILAYDISTIAQVIPTNCVIRHFQQMHELRLQPPSARGTYLNFITFLRGVMLIALHCICACICSFGKEIVPLPIATREYRAIGCIVSLYSDNYHLESHITTFRPEPILAGVYAFSQ